MHADMVLQPAVELSPHVHVVQVNSLGQHLASTAMAKTSSCVAAIAVGLTLRLEHGPIAG